MPITHSATGRQCLTGKYLEMFCVVIVNTILYGDSVYNKSGIMGLGNIPFSRGWSVIAVWIKVVTVRLATVWSSPRPELFLETIKKIGLYSPAPLDHSLV
jgi:hypothetical protein